MKIRLASSITHDSIVDGPGLRTVIWTQGCNHNCLGCHNPETHPLNGGFETSTEEIIEKLKNIKLQKGITFSGGEPFIQPKACSEIARFCHSIGWDVWTYTGYTYEQLLNENNPLWNEFLEQIDVLIDGPFILEKKDLTLLYRGSSNQRIIDIKKSKKNNNIILWEE
ncbi:anaerobic ribonucleoside-triphosphate reductase activating protein [Defluviitalea phaphyphila]|uniref:anaerobic ribonucleoside-triphosphate reductase activating protein n=1 Tax=Defluviitalea phaphyphila TaxID=1473580 RepID=UPI00073187C4|nr:anaerobic ribonucleoside-triphosphate reductase activating protein [Defluviitalea phaphyphila]